jgi:hypothetical protein
MSQSEFVNLFSKYAFAVELQPKDRWTPRHWRRRRTEFRYPRLFLAAISHRSQLPLSDGSSHCVLRYVYAI